MKELISLLRKKERRILGLIGLLLTIAIAFYFLGAQNQKKAFLSTSEAYTAKQNELSELKSNQAEKELEWQQWQEALEDMEKLGADYFYKKDSVVRDLRQDLFAIFDQNSIPNPRIKYDYADFKSESISKILSSFVISGPYFLVKKFIHSVENFPKFLVIEKINFVDIDTRSGSLKLNISLAGYYEDK